MAPRRRLREEATGEVRMHHIYRGRLLQVFDMLWVNPCGPINEKSLLGLASFKGARDGNKLQVCVRYVSTRIVTPRGAAILEQFAEERAAREAAKEKEKAERKAFLEESRQQWDPLEKALQCLNIRRMQAKSRQCRRSASGLHVKFKSKALSYVKVMISTRRTVQQLRYNALLGVWVSRPIHRLV
ncbi:hypothetical protein ACLB2K_073106 [Fragaria x ananassa]